MDIVHNLQSVRERINRAAANSGREPEEIKLIAVTKTHPVEMIQEALNAGITAIGENKVQEAEAKIPFLTSSHIEFHFIGHLQSNKINKLLRLKPVLIHSIDSLPLAESLEAQLDKLGSNQDILVEVNITNESSKSGIDLLNTTILVNQIATLPHLHIRGLMTIGLFDENPEATRPYFKQMKELFDKIQAMHISNVDMDYLSMGMSGDFEIAIEEGANMIRVGSAIFGARHYG